MAELHDVRLLQLPVPIQRRASAYHDALRREFELIRRREPLGDSIPVRIHEIVTELKERFGLLAAQPPELVAAIELGLDAVDVSYLVPPAAAVATRRLDELLDEADRYCRSGSHLLTLATPPDVLAFRRWCLSQFTRQIDAEEPPTSWPDARPDLSDVPAASAAAPMSSMPSLPATWNATRSGDTARLTVAGALDLADAPLLREALQGLQGLRTNTIELDAHRVPFVDSVIIGVIVSAHLRVAEAHGRLVIIPSAQLRRSLDIAGLTQHLHLA